MFQQWKKQEIIINPALNLISYCYLYIVVTRVHDSNRKSNQFPYPFLPLPIQSGIFERSESSYHVFRWAIESCNCRRSDCHNSGCSAPPPPAFRFAILSFCGGCVIGYQVPTLYGLLKTPEKRDLQTVGAISADKSRFVGT